MFKKQSGFIITIELLLITTILIIGISVGIVQVRDALVKRQVAQQKKDITVLDSQNRRLGKTSQLDEHEAPLLAYIDNATDNGSTGRTYIGVRDDRFTSREPVFYDGPNCTGNPCLKGVSDESYNLSVGGVAHSGSVSYINALQGNINYAIGRAAGDSVQGILLRSSTQVCPATVNDIQSVYLSQKVVTGMPCEDFTPPVYDANTSCLVNTSLADTRPGNGNAFGLIENNNPTGIEFPEPCTACPAGTTSQRDILDNYAAQTEADANDALTILSAFNLIEPVEVTLGELCCPEGSRLSEDTQLQDALLFMTLKQVYMQVGIDIESQPQLLDALAALGINPGTVRCIPDIELTFADSVTQPGQPDINVLDQFQAPFKVVVPQQQASEWYHVPPNGEGNLYTRPQGE